MKKYLLFATAACAALAACTKNEVKPVEMDQEITYQTIDTKAASAFSTDHKFYSWAYILASGQNWADKYATSSPYITNSLIEYVSSSKAWKNSTTSYYWPKKAKLTFFAWSDATNDPKVSSPATVACSNDGGIKFDNFNTSVDKNKDLLVSKIAADQTYNSSTTSWSAGVPTVFYHVLSALDVTAATKINYGTTTFKVKSIVFKNVLCKGTYTQGVDATNTPIASNWATVSDKSTFDVYSPDSPSSELSTTAITLAAQDGDVRIYMPQTLPDDAKVAVSYQVTYGSTGITDEVTIEKDLKNIFTEGWKPGYKYTLNIVIGLDEVLWDPDIQPWENGIGDVTI
ncbi:MAG: hypothetical protein PUK22_01535 [Bacteroides sp.]|nr:hypothetical protein [Bacteroides sp.]